MPARGQVGGAGSPGEVSKQIKSLVLQWTEEGGGGDDSGTEARTSGELASEEASPDGDAADADSDGLPANLKPAHGDCGDDGCEIVWD